MNANNIKLGTRLEIEIPDYKKKNDESVVNYISQLIDVIDSKRVSIAAPMYEGRLKFLSAGVKIVAYFINERHDLLCFAATVNGYRKSGPLDVFDLTLEGNLQKIQRRRFYRLDVSLDCQYKIEAAQMLSIDDFVFNEIDEAAMTPAYLKNISCSGMCMVLDELLEQGSVLDVVVELKDFADIRVFAQVVRKISSQGKKHEFGLHFVKIEKHHASILTKFIFERQRMLLRNSTLERENKF